MSAVPAERYSCCDDEGISNSLNKLKEGREVLDRGIGADMDNREPRNDDSQWKILLRRSFHPRQWFTRDDEDYLEADEVREDRIMWVYRRTEATVWTVGYFTPQQEWVPDLDFPTRQEAAARVNYLNGGCKQR